MYSGSNPELVDGDVFRTVMPLSLSDIMSDKVVSDNIHRQTILAHLTDHGEISTAEAAKLIGRSPETARRVLSQLVKEGIVVATGANRNRKYGVVR